MYIMPQSIEFFEYVKMHLKIELLSMYKFPSGKKKFDTFLLY